MRSRQDYSRVQYCHEVRTGRIQDGTHRPRPSVQSLITRTWEIFPRGESLLRSEYIRRTQVSDPGWERYQYPNTIPAVSRESLYPPREPISLQIRRSPPHCVQCSCCRTGARIFPDECYQSVSQRKRDGRRCRYFYHRCLTESQCTQSCDISLN